ncbi:MAG: hypothetical protein IPM29_04190 [Planctomycetes bacterium]|nr:hypothetical protein [Planctomycetota bacterium]
MTADAEPRQPEPAPPAAIESPCSYSVPHFRHVLRKARALGYWTPRVRDVAFGVPERRFFLIRHDVDINPWAAHELATVEREEGATATFYFRLHAPYYNLLEQRVRDLVLDIAAMGHEVGFHYEPGFFLERGLDPVEGTRRDIRIFDELVGFRTHTIAQHRPAEGPLLQDIDPTRPCAYQKALVRDLPYFGDSGHHWREGCICTKLGVHERLHTLLHPHAWVMGDRAWTEVLRANAAGLNARLTAEIEAYIEHVRAYLARRAELDAEREARYRDG